MYWFYHTRKLSFGICAIWCWWLLMYTMFGFDVVSAGKCFWFCFHWCAVPCVIDDQFAQTLSCCMCLLVRWQLMHRWPGASAQFEHLWGQRIGILSMYDSRANGLMRLLGMKLPSPGCWSSAWSCSVEVFRLESLESTSILWAGKGRPSQDVGLWWTFHACDLPCVLRWILVWSLCFVATSLSSGLSVVRCIAAMFGVPLMDYCHCTCFTARFHARLCDVDSRSL